MQAMHDLQDTCARVVVSLNVERGWDLTASQEAAYIAAVAAFAEIADEATLRRLVENYHQDHVLVQALQNAGQPQHNAAWAEVRANMLPVLRFAGLGQSAHPSIDLEDIAQVALDELMKSVHTFRFESRFSTWYYTLVIRRGRRFLRDLASAKRLGIHVALEEAQSISATSSPAADPETVAIGRELSDLINSVLTEAGGLRLARIFQLWFEKDLRLVDIGRQVGLGTARVSALLEHARQVLQAHPDIQAWNHDRAKAADG
jgi:RNA polymerase sigma factor (sigma-70 family)